MLGVIALAIGIVIAGALASAAEDSRQRRYAFQQMQLQRDEQLRYQQARLELHEHIVSAVRNVGASAFEANQVQRGGWQ